jgi:hypothetical protein
MKIMEFQLSGILMEFQLNGMLMGFQLNGIPIETLIPFTPKFVEWNSIFRGILFHSLEFHFQTRLANWKFHQKALIILL